MEEQNYDMRNMLLSELIDKMHGRLADKMFPPDPSMADKPAVEGITDGPKTAEGHEIPYECPPAEHESTSVPEHGDTKGDSTGIPDEDMSDEDLEEMLMHVNKP